MARRLLMALASGVAVLTLLFLLSGLVFYGDEVGVTLTMILGVVAPGLVVALLASGRDWYADVPRRSR
ncbi:hypothetical protein [Nocardioides sp.]|uniref:hypothetical protein n=1 Tax=Nocardioides sp. TaxID=35761 RepID=UPI003528107F